MPFPELCGAVPWERRRRLLRAHLRLYAARSGCYRGCERRWHPGLSQLICLCGVGRRERQIQTARASPGTGRRWGIWPQQPGSGPFAKPKLGRSGGARRRCGLGAAEPGQRQLRGWRVDATLQPRLLRRDSRLQWRRQARRGRQYRAGCIHFAGHRVGQSAVRGGPILNPKQCRLPACRRFERRSYPRPGGASTRRRGRLPEQRQWHFYAQELYARFHGHRRCNGSRFQPGREAGFRHHRELAGARQWRWHFPNARAADAEPSDEPVRWHRRRRSER